MGKWLDKETSFKKIIPVEISPIKNPPVPNKREVDQQDDNPYRPGATGEDMLPTPKVRTEGYDHEEQSNPNAPKKGFPKRDVDYKSVWAEGGGEGPTGPTK